MDNRPEHNNITYFTGIEVEHSPAHGKKTLFVIGLQPAEEIADHLMGCEHIYFGANMSFPNPECNDAETWDAWAGMVRYFLDKGYFCTLDIGPQSVTGLLESSLTEHNNFIPMISVKLPYLQQLGYNATIKLDDVDFNATNPGVWCHSLHDLMDRRVFTDWSKYTKDEPL